MRIIIIFVAFGLVQLAVGITPEALKTKLPQIEDWTIIEEVEVYHPDNLYDKINGAAPGFIIYGFEELTVFEYTVRIR